MAFTGRTFNVGTGKYQATFFTDQTAAGDGAWYGVETMSQWSVHITDMTAGDIVTISVSSAIAVPTDSDDHITHSTLSEDGIVTEPANTYRWIKVHKSDGTGGGSTDAVFFGKI